MTEPTPAKALQHDPDLVRPSITGPESGPESPYPIYLEGWVERGFGRGSKDLGCPTANLPSSSILPYSTETLTTGVHYGFAKVFTSATGTDEVLPMVMSIGWNPFYGNKTRTAEVHILKEFEHDFYGQELRVVMLGFIRPEYDYAGMDALIKDINFDKEVALNSVKRGKYVKFEKDEFFEKASTLKEEDRVKAVEGAKKEGE